MADYIQSTPTPQLITLIFKLIRFILVVLGTIGIYHGTIADSTLEIVAGALADLISAAWSFYQAWADEKRLHESVVQSIMNKKPVKMAVKLSWPAFLKEEGE